MSRKRTSLEQKERRDVTSAHGQREPESVARSHASDAELSYTRVVVSAIGHRETEHRETFVDLHSSMTDNKPCT